MRVATHEYHEIAGRLSLKQQNKQIASAFHQLATMAHGKGEPDFDDPWIALFYLLWYHPRQVNLFYSIFRPLLESQAAADPPCSAFQIVDFGCGALAAQMGLMLAYHSAFEPDHMPHVAITNIDRSKSMTAFGRHLWTEWSRELDRAGLTNLHDLCNAVPFKTAHHRIAKVTNVNENAIRYLIASNVAFPSNLDAVHQDLARLWSDVRPDSAIVTTIGYRIDIEQMACAFEASAWNGRDIAPMPELAGPLEAITAWRAALGQQLATRGTDSIVQNFLLKKKVEWSWGPATKVGHFIAPQRAQQMRARP